MEDTRKLKAGECLFREGDKPEFLYIIKTGTVSIRKSHAGKELEIAKLNSGEVLGELSFFDREPRSASAIAVTDLELVQLDFEALESICDGVPPYVRTIMVAVADRLRKANDTIRRLQKDSIAGQDGTPDVSGTLLS